MRRVQEVLLYMQRPHIRQWPRQQDLASPAGTPASNSPVAGVRDLKPEARTMRVDAYVQLAAAEAEGATPRALPEPQGRASQFYPIAAV